MKHQGPEYDEKIAAIRTALPSYDIEHPVFYEDEVDIDLDPKIGSDYCLKDQQKTDCNSRTEPKV